MTQSLVLAAVERWLSSKSYYRDMGVSPAEIIHAAEIVLDNKHLADEETGYNPHMSTAMTERFGSDQFRDHENSFHYWEHIGEAFLDFLHREIAQAASTLPLKKRK